MASSIGFKSGRSWHIGSSSGIESLKRVYIVERGDSISTEEASFVGVPAIGSAHPSYDGLFVASYDVQEREYGGKKYLDVTVNYSSTTTSIGDINRVPRGQDIQAWGWRYGSVSRDLVINLMDGMPILNSAGQPFDSAPQYDVASPVFTKVVKTNEHKSWRQYANKINNSQVTIGGETFAAKTLRCVQVDEERLWNDEFGWKYQYTIGVQYVSNMVSIEGKSEAEIGWNIAVTDAGCYVLEDNGLKRISWVDQETGKVCYATTPKLLNGQGGELTGDTPWNFEIQAYGSTKFPDDFFSDEPKYNKPADPTPQS